MSDPVTQSDHQDLRDQVAGLLRYVEQLCNQHQALADSCEEEFGKLHQRLGGQPDTTLTCLHKASGDSQIQDADAAEVEEQQVVSEIERMARGEL